MKETIDFSANPSLNMFSSMLSDNFSLLIGAITLKSVSVSLDAAYKADLLEVVNGYEGRTHVIAREENTNAELGLLMRTNAITALADLMLAGEGEGQEELDSEILDAVKELASQVLSGLNVPLEGAYSNKFSIKVANVDVCSATAHFEANEYSVFDYTLSFDDRQMQFRFFIDETLENYLSGGGASAAQEEAPQLSGLDFFSTPAPAPVHEVNVPTQNLDLLLDIDIPISVRMGTTKLFLKDILGLGPGNIVELEQNAGEPIELAVNDKVVARGEVVIIDGYFGFRIKEIISKAERLKKLKD